MQWTAAGSLGNFSRPPTPSCRFTIRDFSWTRPWSGAPIEQELLTGAGIPVSTLDDPDGRISYAQFSALERLAQRLTNDPGLALRWGQATYFSHLGLAGLAAMSSVNLGDAFRIAEEHSMEILPAWRMHLRVEENRGYIELEETLDRGDLLRFSTEAVTSGLYSLVHQVLRRTPPVTRIRFKYSRPAHHALYAAYLGNAEFTFDEPVTEAEFDAAILSQRMATSAPGTSRLLERASANDAHGPRVTGLVAQVREELAKAGMRRLSLTEVARALQTSTRSLRRGLNEMGTSYQEIAEQALRARAEKLVRTDGAKIDVVAQELGFTDARSFRRAFKRWTGQSPNDFRRRET